MPKNKRNKTDSHLLDITQWCNAIMVRKSTKFNMESRDYENLLGYSLAVLLAAKKRDFIEISEYVPTTWWGHFKATHPSLCRYLKPPRYREIGTVITRWHICPHLEVPYGNHLNFLVHEQTGGDCAEDD